MQRVCVIGLGPIGNRHADIHQENPLAQLVGVCDIIRERADAAAARLGVPAFYDAPTMLAELQPDICSIATGGEEYGSDHALPTIQALEAGSHVLCEKPISNDIADAVKMVETARRLNRCFGIDLNHRFNPAHRLAKQWVEEGRLGHLLFINMAMWIMNPRESSPYFQLKALHPHTVDIMRYFCGDIEAVRAAIELSPMPDPVVPGPMPSSSTTTRTSSPSRVTCTVQWRASAWRRTLVTASRTTRTTSGCTASGSVRSQGSTWSVIAGGPSVPKRCRSRGAKRAGSTMVGRRS